MAEANGGPDGAKVPAAKFQEKRPEKLPIAGIGRSGLQRPKESGLCSPAKGSDASGSSPFLSGRAGVSSSGKRREIVSIQKPSSIQDHYDFGNILGKGGFGVVSEILHAKTFQPFAGKVVQKSDFRTESEEHLFRRVMEVLLNNEHPNVVKLVHVFEDEVNCYVVMEKCAGGTLYQYRKDHGDLLPSVLEDICGQILLALEFLHMRDMIHRDIKTENIMFESQADEISKTGNVLKLVDFDMCAFLEDGAVTSSSIQGTPGYLAPEVFESRRYTLQSDLFAFGCVMYNVLMKKQPCPELTFGGNRSTEELTGQMAKWIEATLKLCEHSSSEGSAFPKRADLEPAEAAILTNLERLMCWCLKLDPTKRPKNTIEVWTSDLLSEKLCDLMSPQTVRSGDPSSPKTKGKRKEKTARQQTGIDALLRCGADPMSPGKSPKS